MNTRLNSGRPSLAVPMSLLGLACALLIGSSFFGQSIWVALLALLAMIGLVAYPSLPVTIFYPALWSAWNYALPGIGKLDLLFGLMAFAGMIIHVLLKRDPLPPIPRLILVGSALLFGSYMIAWMLSPSLSNGMAYFISLSTRILFMYLVYTHIRTSKQLRLASTIYIASAFVVACLVLLISSRYGFGFNRTYGLPLQVQEDIGTFWYRAAISFSFGGAPALLLMGLYPLTQHRYQKILIAVGVIFLFWMAFSAEYRREILVSFVLLLSFLAISGSAKVRRPAVALLLIGTVLFGVVLLPHSAVLQDRLGRETDIALAGNELRQISFKAGLDAFLQSPLLGSGPGNYDQVVTPRVDPKLYLAYGLTRVPAFNVFIWIAVEGGLFAMLGFVLILIGVYRVARMAVLKVPRGVEGWILRCAPILMLQIVLWASFGNAWEVSISWFLMGLILAAARLAKEQPDKQTIIN